MSAFVLPVPLILPSLFRRNYAMMEAWDAEARDWRDNRNNDPRPPPGTTTPLRWPMPSDWGLTQEYSAGSERRGSTGRSEGGQTTWTTPPQTEVSGRS